MRKAERDELFREHARFAYWAAKRLRERSRLIRRVPAEDCAQVAALALLRAIDTWDASKGAKLTTWAFYKIGACLQDAAQVAGVVRLPSTLLRCREPEGNPSPAREAARRAISVRPLPASVREACGKRRRDDGEGGVEDAVRGLRPQQRLVLRLIYGEGLTQREAAGRLGLTRQRVQQVHAAALRSLRAAGEQ